MQYFKPLGVWATFPKKALRLPYLGKRLVKSEGESEEEASAQSSVGHKRFVKRVRQYKVAVADEPLFF